MRKDGFPLPHKGDTLYFLTSISAGLQKKNVPLLRFTFWQVLIAGVLEKRDTFLNQKSSQSPFSKRRMSPWFYSACWNNDL